MNLVWVEHRDRELGYAKLLAEQLASHGFGSTTILSLPFHLPLAALLSPQRVFVPFLKSGQDATLAILRRAPRRVYVTHYEQLLGHFNREAKRPRLPGAVHLYWYTAFEEILDAWNVPADDRVRIPAPETRLLSTRAIEQGLHRGRDGASRNRVAFIPENYSWAFADASTLNKKAAAGFKRAQIERLRDYSSDSLDLFAPQLLEACLHWPQVAFVLRPHPSVTVEAYEAKLKRHGELPPNLVISKARSAWDWVGGSDAVVSGWSTVAYAARELGIPAALHHPLPLIAELDVPWVRAMPCHTNFNECIGQLLSTVNSAGRVNPISFDGLLAELQAEGQRPPLVLPRPHRTPLVARAMAALAVRATGLMWRPQAVRAMNVYHADYFHPLQIANAAP